MSYSAAEFKKRFDQVCPHGTQAVVAKFANIPSSQISDWKNPKSNKEPFVEQIERLALALGVEPSWLAFGIDPLTVEEQQLSILWKKLTDDERRGFRATLEAITAGRPEPPRDSRVSKEAIPPGTLISKEGKFELYEPTKTAFSSPPQPAPRSLPPLPTDEEVRAFLSYLGQELKKMPREHPLPRALRKIATRLKHDIDAQASLRDQAHTPETKASLSPEAATSKAPAEPVARRKSHGSA